MEKGNRDFYITEIAALAKKMRRMGLSPELLENIEEGTCVKLKRVLESTSAFMHPKHIHIVDTLPEPLIYFPAFGFSLKKHIPYGGEGLKRIFGNEGLLVLEPTLVSFYVSPGQHRPLQGRDESQGPGMAGYNLQSDIGAQTLVPLNATVLDYFYMYPYLLPLFMDEKKWSEKNLFFWGTEYEYVEGDTTQIHVPYIWWTRSYSGVIEVSKGTKHMYEIFGPSDVAVCYGTMSPAEQ